MKSNGIMAKVNLAKNWSKIFSRFVIAMPNLRWYKKMSDFANLSNLPNIFFRS